MLGTQVVEQRRQDMLRQARRQQLRHALLGHRRALYRRWLANLADLMIASGGWLKRHFDASPAQRDLPADGTPAMEMGWKHL
ncbi:MAG: hypothetical protein JNL34_08165 [Anaerolineae bacterium]|nr:hypothetical protein [Anaerolineae bacterium]